MGNRGETRCSKRQCGSKELGHRNRCLILPLSYPVPLGLLPRLLLSPGKWKDLGKTPDILPCNSKSPAPQPLLLILTLLVALGGPGNLSNVLGQPEALPGLAPAVRDTGLFQHILHSSPMRDLSMPALAFARAGTPRSSLTLVWKSPALWWHLDCPFAKPLHLQGFVSAAHCMGWRAEPQAAFPSCIPCIPSPAWHCGCSVKMCLALHYREERCLVPRVEMMTWGCRGFTDVFEITRCCEVNQKILHHSPWSPQPDHVSVLSSPPLLSHPEPGSRY